MPKQAPEAIEIRLTFYERPDVDKVLKQLLEHLDKVDGVTLRYWEIRAPANDPRWKAGVSKSRAKELGWGEGDEG